eukprot:Transcript_4903.p1 GENE.Transcript_4903~~Transcript_4903.p1  ORF type:complete len:726 (+),score=74.45 Transcript_4903:159-2180(+)
MALSVLMSTTDICSSFIQCPAQGTALQRCRPRRGAGWHRAIQGLYGSFREAYSSGLLPERARPDVEDVRAATRRACVENVDLVLNRGCNDPVLAPLAQLLSQAPLGTCVRVIVLERCAAPSGGTAYRLPSLDLRDQLFDVRRVAAPPSRDSIGAYRAWAAGNTDPVSSVLFLPAGWHLMVDDLRGCGTVSLFKPLAIGRQRLALQLPTRPRVVRLARAAVDSSTQASIDSGAASADDASCEGRAETEPHHLPLLARLLSAATRAKAATRFRSSVGLATLGGRRGSVSLSCLEPDFMLYNRVLLPSAYTEMQCANENSTGADVLRFASLVAAVQQLGAGTPRCDPRKLLRTALLPAGWFSTLHGLVKPLSRALRSGKTLLTPAVQEFTSAEDCQGGRRDLGCFFRPLAPTTCDVRGVRVADLQDAKFVQRESPKHGGVIPQAFASRGWFWWTAHLLGVLLQPGPSLARAVAASLRSTGLGAALRDGAVLGMHVRHGDACLAGERVRMARTCSPLAEYMQQARPLTRALGVTTIYLATDSEQVLQDTRLFPEFRFLHLPNVSRFGVSAPAPTRLWDAIVKRRAKRPATRRRNHREAWMATVDALLLARCDAFVGKFTSTLFRTAYALQAAECDCAVPFVSLDAPWCFDYGLRGGSNWAFPLVGEDGTVQDNRFWC